MPTAGTSGAAGPIIGGRYQLTHALAEGAFGSVHVARDLRTQATVVVKVQRPTSPQFAAIFEREARLLARVNSANVVRYLDFIVEGDQSYLVQEHIADAIPFEVWQAGRTLPALFQAYATLAHTLGELHRDGIVHRDLKPANVLIRQSQPVLIDFGLAVRSGEPDTLTRTGTAVGTPAYMAPEAIVSDAELGPPADVFALGVMLYEALTGSLPEGTAVSVGDLLRARSTGNSPWASIKRIAAIRELGPLQMLLSRMLATTPSLRPSAKDAALHLAILADEPRLEYLAAPLQATESSVPAPPSATVLSPRLAPASANQRLPRWRTLGLVAAPIVLALVLAFTLSANRAFSSVDVLHLFGWGLMIGLAAAAGVFMLQELAKPSPLPLDSLELSPEAARRIQAIEAHVARTDEFTRSLAVNLEELVQQRLDVAIRASLLSALKDLKPADAKPASDVQHLIALIGKLAIPSPTPPPQKSAFEKVQGVLGLSLALFTAVGGGIGLLSSLGVWKPQQPPKILSFKADPARLPAGGAALLTVEAEDPDGDVLKFEYTTSAGTIYGQGPSARLVALDVPVGAALAVGVAVSDGHSPQVHKTIAVFVQAVE